MYVTRVAEGTAPLASQKVGVHVAHFWSGFRLSKEYGHIETVDRNGCADCAADVTLIVNIKV